MRDATLGCGMGMGGAKKTAKIPNRGRVDSFPTELRGVEMGESARASVNFRPAPSPRGEEPGSAIHDATHLNRDRDFRPIGLFIIPGLKYDPPLIINGIHIDNNCINALAHTFAPPTGSMGDPAEISLTTHRGHMRWLKPSNTTKESLWANWENPRRQYWDAKRKHGMYSSKNPA